MCKATNHRWISKCREKTGVNFSLLERINRHKWQITFENKDGANNAIKNRYAQQSNYKIDIPEYMLYRKVIVKGIPVDISKGEFLDELRASNPGLVCEEHDFFRLRARVYVRVPVALSHIYMWRSRIPVTLYIPSIRQCFNCGQLNHSTFARTMPNA